MNELKSQLSAKYADADKSSKAHTVAREDFEAKISKLEDDLQSKQVSMTLAEKELKDKVVVLEAQLEAKLK